MSERKKPPKVSNANPLADLDFNEALARLVQTDPEEISDAFERNKQRANEIEQNARDRRNRLRSAIRK